jgi:tetratricopeptide (TPR) repeat protein
VGDDVGTHFEPRRASAPLASTGFRAAALVFAIAWALYARVLDYDWSWLDDKVLILDQQDWLANWGSVFSAFSRTYFAQGSSYYRPIVSASYVLDAQWSAAGPFGFHFTNVLLHSVAAVLVFSLLRRMKAGQWLAGFGAALFAVHPALVETVAWIPGRNDSLLAIFSLAALLALARDADSPSLQAKFTHLACFAAALFTKETAVILPMVMVAFIALAEGRYELLKARWMWGGWFGLLVVYFVARASVVASVPGEAALPVQTMFHQLPVMIASIGKLVLPVALAPIAIAKDTPVWPGFAAIAALGALAYAVQGVKRPTLLFGAIALVAPLLPALFMSDKLTLENRLYLPAVGLVIFVVEIGRALNLERRMRLGAGTGLVGLGALLASRYQPVFQNRAAFVEAATQGSPNSSLAHLQRGLYYQQIDHDLDKATVEYQEAIACDTTEAMAHNDLGVVWLTKKRFKDAENEFRAELAHHPGTAFALYNLALALRSQGQVAEAVSAFEETLRCNPDHLDAMGELLEYYSLTKNAEKEAYYTQEMTKRGVKFFSPNSAGARVPR